MRFNTPLKTGNSVRIDYDDIQWDNSTAPETLDRTGERSAIAGTVEHVVGPKGSMDEYARITTEHGEYKVFANGDVFALSARGDSDLIGIDAAVTVTSDRKMVV